MTKRKKQPSKYLTVDKDKQISKLYPWLTRAEKKVLLHDGYFNSEGVLTNSDGRIQCTSMLKSTGKRCKNFALEGETTCRLHGGALARQVNDKQKHIYSPFIEDSSLKSVYEFGAIAKEFSGVQEELSLLRTLLGSAIEHAEGKLSLKELNTVSKIIGEIRQLVNDCSKAEIRLGQLIDIGKVTTIVKQLANIIARNIKDEALLEKISNEFDNVLWPAPLGTTPQPERQEPVQAISEITSTIR